MGWLNNPEDIREKAIALASVLEQGPVPGLSAQAKFVIENAQHMTTFTPRQALKIEELYERFIERGLIAGGETPPAQQTGN